ncbi:MAG: insulinase family protein [Bacteroidaceae bacterium]|nr:insulinase family protein [Bacteroidaceae bacterium]
MLDRTQCPVINPLTDLDIQQPEREIMPNGVPLNILRAGNEEVLRMDILIGAGTWHQALPLQALFTNRMLREGTLHLTSSEIAERLDFYGAWMELSTSMNCNFLTLYSLNKFFPQSLAILSAMMKEATFPEEEMKVTVESNRQQFIVNSTKVDVMARKEFNKVIFGEHHPCGRHAVLEDYDRLTTQDLKGFYRRFYHSENCSIYLSGYVTEAILNQIRNEFGSAPWGEPSLCEPLTPLPTPVFEGRRIHIEYSTAVQSSVRLGCPLMDRNHPDFSGMKVLTTVLGGYFGSRLMSNIREEKGYTYGISATIASYPFQGYLAIGTETANEYVEPCIREVKNEIRRLQEERISEQELTMVKNYMMGEMCRSYEGPFSLSDAWIFVETAGLEKNFFLTHAKKIRSVTADELRDLAIKYFRPDDMLEVVAGKKM